ncbi:MAG: hypothetical protein KBE85_03470, partial [Bacteroides sp.]|nr:hypothetical protein [Bacteroides sp.]
PVGDLTFVKSTVETLYGPVTIHWTRKSKAFTIHLTVPVNCTASVYLPGESQARQVGSGQHQFTNHQL